MADIFSTIADWASGKNLSESEKTPPWSGAGWAENRTRELIGRSKAGAPLQQLRGFNEGLQPRLQAGAQRTVAGNPYQEAIANQSRAAQMALMNQMRQQQAGPSLAAMQGQQAMGRMGQQALGGAAVGGPGANRAAMLQAGAGSSGAAMDTAQGRLGETLRSQMGLGGMAGGMRANALRGAEDQQRLGLQAQSQADQNARLNTTLGTTLSGANRDAFYDYYKMLLGLNKQGKAQEDQSKKDVADTTATVLGMFLPG